MLERLSLFDELGTGQAEASVLTTYSVYLPFYENVVLPRLQGIGSRINVVLVDAAQCRRAFADPSTRPRRAGVDYALLPVPAAGAFHPKLALLLGQKAGRLFVGSHNLTIAGFGHNRELTTRFSIGAGSQEDGAYLAEAALGLITAWIEHVPEEAQAWLANVRRMAPWADSTSRRSAVDPVLVGTTRRGPSLWAQVRPLLPARLRQVLVLGAFYDHELSFLKQIAEVVNPGGLIVGIDPGSTEIPDTARTMVPSAQFVDASGMAEASGYLHAKALVFRGADGEEVLVTGSANPSAPAWLAGNGTGNLEAVVVQREAPGASLAAALQLDTLPTQPPVTLEAWAAIAARHAQHARERVSGQAACVVVAMVIPAGFRIASSDLPPGAVTRVDGYLDGQPTGIALPHQGTDDGLMVQVPNGTEAGRIRALEIHSPPAGMTLGIPFDPGAVRLRVVNEAQKALERFLLSLQTALPDLGGLVGLVTKVVNARNIAVSPGAPTGHRRSAAGPPPTPAAPPESLAIDSASEDPARRRGRYLAEEEDALLLDTLIHVLGQGLHGPASPQDLGRNEEERGDEPAHGQGRQDERKPRPEKSENGPEQPRISPEQAAATLRQKVRTLLLRRLVPQVKQAYEESTALLQVAYDTATVLAMAKALAYAEQHTPDLPAWERYVDPEDLGDLMRGSVWELCHGDDGLLTACLREHKVTGSEEVSSALGLMMWAARAAGLDARPPLREIEPELREEVIRDRSCLLWLALRAAQDAQAERFTRAAIHETCGAEDRGAALQWCAEHYRWGTALRAATRAMPTWTAPRQSEVGDVSWLRLEDGETVPTLVARVDQYVVLVDPTRDKWERKFVRGHRGAILPPEGGWFPGAGCGKERG